jgi:hypothetical protein
VCYSEAKAMTDAKFSFGFGFDLNKRVAEQMKGQLW